MDHVHHQAAYQAAKRRRRGRRRGGIRSGGAAALLAAVAARDPGACVDLIYAAVGWSTPAHVADLSAALRKAAEVGAPRICKVPVAVGAGVNHCGCQRRRGVDAALLRRV